MAAMEPQALMQRLPEAIQTFKQERLASLRPPQEFFDMQRVSRPADFNAATQRVNYNVKYYSGNYIFLILLLAVYSLLTNPLLLIAIGFLAGGFVAITKYITEDVQFGSTVVTQRNMYTGLLILGLPMLWFAAPIATLMWLIGSSAVLIIGHAALIEPGVESEYGSVQTV
ncbi:hypothetical protein ACM66B_000312 [Microbotryomycetes sp. NB124-2]